MTNGLMTQFVQETANAVREQNKYTTQSNQRYKATEAANSDNDGGSSQSITDGNESLGKDSFLQLLVTQLRYQDPLSPMDNKAFISQMAQFSSLEQMNNMNKNMESILRVESLSQGAAMVGKTVETIDAESGEVITGKVERVSFEGGDVFVYLDNDLKIDINDVTAIQ